eukprot:CAMPEP_0113639506 /NCGR_PEP_ID=MMETSP0017_2-20120614/20724_1 /TAXON_ID=2856 /ORGANISM="Cylindrotheca closterium" /LENGTH=118 /DNA_ID=CAMNT_0000550721 /DNA_START=105 /DNA_END=461 /DNA_ORIENTATION=- /assembly_acc=CAM_ASM_000147
MSLLFGRLSRTLMRRTNLPTNNTTSLFSSRPPSSASANMMESPAFSLVSLRFKGGVKTNSGAKKRFRVRGSGSIKRRRSGTSHNTGYKPRQSSNRLGSSTGIEGKKMEQRVRKLLGVF